VTLTAIGDTPASRPPNLELSTPTISGYSVSVNGYTSPGTSGTKISEIYWDWGDGSTGDSWFEATHTYANSGTYTIMVTTHQSDGQTTTKTTQATISGTASSPRPNMTAKSISSAFTSGSDIDTILYNAGLPSDVPIVKVNVDDSIQLSEPLVILGSSVDSMEQQLFDALAKKYEFNQSWEVYDSTRTFQQKSIEEYDIVVIGGPLHNSYAGELLSRGVLKYKTTNLNKTGLVIESEKLPSGHTVVIVGDTDGYTYTYQTPQNYSTNLTLLITPRPPISLWPTGTAPDLSQGQVFGTYINDPINQKILIDAYWAYTGMHVLNPYIKIYMVSLGNGHHDFNVVEETPSQDVLKDTYLKYLYVTGQYSYGYGSNKLEALIWDEKDLQKEEKMRKQQFYQDVVDQFLKDQEAQNNLEE
jgi:hypothetical protein